MINPPYIRTDLTSDQYHAADATPEPALQSGLAAAMTSLCPRAVWHAHPALNPDFRPTDRKIFDLGKAAHARVLEGDSFQHAIEIILAPDFKTKAAQSARDDAYAAGKIPMLEPQVAQVEDMAAELFDDEIASLLLAHGLPERSHFWIDRATGIWCKARPDWYVDSRDCTSDLVRACEWTEPQSIIVNYKTHGGSIKPKAFGKHVADLQYVQRAAWEMDGVHRTTGQIVDQYVILAQETTPPYLVAAFAVERNDLEYGHSFNRVALNEFARCLARGKEKKFWPGYRTMARPDVSGLIPLDLPPWARMEMEQLRIDHTDRAKLRKLAAETSAKIAPYFAPT